MNDVTLTIVESTPVNLSFNCFDVVAWAATVQEFDNDAAAVAAGVPFYKASANHDAAAKGTLIIL